MREYRGLSEQQFEQVRDMVDTMAGDLPAEFTLRFNDMLIRSPRTRTMSLHQLTETWKGWHVIVRPNGDIRTAVRAWGRSWRTDETVGSVHAPPLVAMIESCSGSTTPFTHTEEVARKFHLGTSAPLILADIHDVAAAEDGRPAPHTLFDRPISAAPAPAAALGVDLGALAETIRREPGRYRVREEDGFTLLFDTRRHDVYLLTRAEFSSLGLDLVGVRS